MTIAAVAQPSSFLLTPSPSGHGLSPGELRREAGALAGAIDAAVDALTGFSILEEWVAKPLAGDWDAFGRAGDAWESAGKAVGAVAENMVALGPQAAGVWHGEAALAFSASQAKIAGALMVFRPLAIGMKAWFEALVELAGWIAKLIMQAIKELSAKVAAALASLAVPLVGWAAQAAWIATIVETIVRWMRRIIEAIQTFLSVVKQVKQIIEAIRDVIRTITRLLAAAQAALAMAGLGDTPLGAAASGAGSVAAGADRAAKGAEDALGDAPGAPR